MTIAPPGITLSLLLHILARRPCLPSIAIGKKGCMIIPDNSPLGNCVQAELRAISEKEPRLQIKRFVIMPDHIHFVLHVTARLEKPVGKHLAPFSMRCSRAYTGLFSLPEFTTLFKPFDDSIIFNYQQLSRAIQYVEDNPRRYLIRRRHPDLFKRHLSIVIGGHEFAAYGNMFLLKSQYLLPVRIHRRWSKEEFDQYFESCIKEVSKGAILIHKVEKDIVRAAIEGGGSVIMVRDLSFNERFKPTGEYFDLCAEGRLLFMCPWPENAQRRSVAGYDVFHQMNDFAASIAYLPATERLIIRIS